VRTVDWNEIAEMHLVLREYGWEPKAGSPFFDLWYWTHPDHTLQILTDREIRRWHARWWTGRFPKFTKPSANPEKLAALLERLPQLAAKHGYVGRRKGNREPRSATCFGR
jgi:hypothetical protein